MSSKLLDCYQRKLIKFHVNKKDFNGMGVKYIGIAKGVAYFTIRDPGAHTTLGILEGEQVLKDDKISTEIS